MRPRLKDIIRNSLTGSLSGALVSYLFYRSETLAFILVPAGALLFPMLRREKMAEERRRSAGLEFRESLEILSNYIRSGYSVENAFKAALGELRKIFGDKAYITREYALINKGIAMNVPVELLLSDFAKRSGIPDIQNFSEVFGIAKRTGGDIGRILERTASVIKEKASVNEEILTLTASVRYEQLVMNILPFLVILYIDLTSPGFMDIMYSGTPGRVIMTAALLLLCLGIFLSGRIMRINV